MRTLVQRVVVTLVSTIFLAAAGGTRRLSCWVTPLYFDRRKPGSIHYANRILLEGITSSAESRAILATMNSSPYAFCSDAEIEYFRQLIFQSQFLKAAGRMQSGSINCSTTSGRTVLAASRHLSRRSPARTVRRFTRISPRSASTIRM